MLISKGITDGEVVTIKLISGEEIITKLVSTNETYYVISKPVNLVAAPGNKGMALQQWLLTSESDQNIKIDKDKVIVIATTASPISKQYIGGTTGLSIP